MSDAAPDHRSPGLIVLLASLVALGPLTIDMYLPALPGMVDAFATDTARVQLTISAYLLGFSLFHLACGPLADRFGRRPVVLAGLALYAAATVACALAETIEQLIAYRVVQGVGACVGPTLGRTIARDLYGPQGAARALALIAMIMALAPAVAPTLGSLMLAVLPWPWIFLSLAAYSLLVAIIVGWKLPESLPVQQALHPVNIARNYSILLRHAQFRETTVASALLYAGMICFLSGASFVFIEMMGVPLEYFGALFLTTVAGYIGGSALSARLAIHRRSETVMWQGGLAATGGAVLMLVGPLVWFHPASIVVPMALYVGGVGIALPHAMAMALRPFAEMAGTASALFGFIQMGLSAVAGAVVGALLNDSPLPMTAAILLCSLLSLLLIWRLRHGDMAY
ncbi:MAG: multidrug effflux MFS transporter [Halieaceae bacterium]|nr:multidrug effflux MFS transporter [Halieaceae bacterium]